MGWLGGLTRGVTKGYIGHKTGQLQGREAKRKADEDAEAKRLAAIDRASLLAKREREALIDALELQVAQKKAARTPADELKEFEEKERIRAKYPSSPPKADPPGYTERRDQAMIRYRDQLVKQGKTVEEANKLARARYMRDRPSTDDLAALLGAWGGGQRTQPTP
jgi:hypothetical protein